MKVLVSTKQYQGIRDFCWVPGVGGKISEDYVVEKITGFDDEILPKEYEEDPEEHRITLHIEIRKT
jgi:hypothetical protein